ncbi:MAG: EAL domain-containing protein [Cyanobacteria bacterium REEB459]|nr:EAL domain-containing protein [Cyanobacteria bacterium REEB459]
MLAIPDFSTRSGNATLITQTIDTKFREIFEQVQVGACQITLDGYLLDANLALCRILGYEWSELVGKSLGEITHPDDGSQLWQNYHHLQTAQINSLTLEHRYLHRDGRCLWVTLTLDVIRNCQGEPMFVVGICQDISDRKAAEMALRRIEERFAVAIQDSRIGVWDWYLPTDTLYISPNFTDLLGYGTSPGTMTDWQAAIHPADAAGFMAALMQYREQAQPVLPFEHTYRFYHQDGSLRWVVSRGQRIGNDSLPLRRMAGTHTDITAIKQAEAALQASHGRINDILESITDGFFALDQEFQFTYLNQRAEQFLQRSRQDLLGQHLWSEFPTMLGSLFSQHFRQVLVERRTACFEEYLSQSQSWYEVRVYPTQEGLAVYFQDITKRRLAYERIQHQIRREQALNRVIQAIRQSLHLDTIFATAAREVADLLAVDHVNIQMYKPDALVWQVVAEYRADSAATSLLHVVTTTDPSLLNSAEVVQLHSDQDLHPLTQTLPGCWLLVPLSVSDGVTWGCLGIHRSPTSQPLWQESEIELVQIVATQLAIAIQQAQTLDQAQQELQERQRTEARLKEAQRIAHTGNWEISLPSRSLIWSEEMFRIYGLDPQSQPLSLEAQLLALDPADRPLWEHQFALACLEGQAIDLEGAIRGGDGQCRFVHLLGQVQRHPQGAIRALVGTLTDITSRKQIEARLAYEAFHDPLTGIPNRACFMEQLQRAVDQVGQTVEAAFAVLFIDLDRFKVINDGLGHLAGDQLLIECAKRLRSVVRDEDLVARLGGDEFAILIKPITTISDPVKVADRIHEVLQEPMLLVGREIFISASIGVSSTLTGSVETGDFLRDADTAMYQAKAQGRGRSALFTPQMYEQVSTQLALENDLQRALERQELALEYQPIVDLASGNLLGLEALLRWNHHHWGAIPPSTFIPLAEETGLILPIGEWTQRQACQQLHQWQQRFSHAASLVINVNLSVKQFTHSRLLTSIDETLSRTGLGGHCLRFEITESALIENPEMAEALLLALQERGIQLCIDDFGTGYSSLSMVHRFPVQVLKIDRSFIHRMTIDQRGTAMVQAILALVRSLEMTAIAEGVETAAQLTQLRQLGCPYAQGVHFSKPLTAEETTALLATWPQNQSWTL